MILECGFGAGDWSVEVAEQYPDAEVRIYALLLQNLPPLSGGLSLNWRILHHNKC
jgi:hypothetical protein